MMVMMVMMTMMMVIMTMKMVIMTRVLAFAGLDEDSRRSLPTASAEQSVLKKKKKKKWSKCFFSPISHFSPTSQSHHQNNQ